MNEISDSIFYNADLSPHSQAPKSRMANGDEKDLQVCPSKSLISKYTTPLAAIATAGAFFVHSGISLNLAAGAFCAAGATRFLKEYRLKKEGKPLAKLALCIAGLAAAMVLFPQKHSDFNHEDTHLNDKYADLNVIVDTIYRKSCLEDPDCNILDERMKTVSEKYFNNLLVDKYGVPSKDIVSSLCISRGTVADLRLDCLANIKRQTFDKLISLNSGDVGANHLSSDEDANGKVTELWTHGYIDLKKNNKYVTEYENAMGHNLHLQIHLFSNLDA